MVKKQKDWYPAFIKKLIAQELKEQELQSEAWLKENDARGKDNEYQKKVSMTFFDDEVKG